MKQYIFSLCAILSIGQCHSMSNYASPYNTLIHLYSPVKNLPIEQITYTWLKNLSSVIAEITTYAIEKSKNVLGKRDTNLTAVATEVSDITNKICKLYLNIKTNIQQLKTNSRARLDIASEVDNLTTQLTHANQKINQSHITISKQQAQKALQETIKFLKNPILTDIEQEIMLLNPQHFA